MFRAAFEKAGIDLVVTTTPLEQDVYVDTDMWEKVWQKTNIRKGEEGQRRGQISNQTILNYILGSI